MAWGILFLAGLCEIAWAVGLKYTDGFTRPLPTALGPTLDQTDHPYEQARHRRRRRGGAARLAQGRSTACHVPAPFCTDTISGS